MAGNRFLTFLGAAGRAASDFKNSVVKNSKEAFEATYSNTGHRVILKDRPYHSALHAFFGTPVKYSRAGEFGPESYQFDQNYYNWFEQVTFFLPRVAKNTAKLVTEFIPQFLTRAAFKVSLRLKSEAELLNVKANGGSQFGDDDVELSHPKKATKPSKSSYFGNKFLSGATYLAVGVLLLVTGALELVTLVLQSITSPFASMKQSYAFFAKDRLGDPRGLGWKAVGVSVAFLRGLIALAAYTAIAVFAAPALGALLGGTAVGAAMGTGINSALLAISNTPIIGTIGSGLVTGLATVGSYLGLSTGAAFAASATAFLALVATPALAGLKVLLRYFSHNRDEPGPLLGGQPLKKNSLLLPPLSGTPKNKVPFDAASSPETELAETKTSDTFPPRLATPPLPSVTSPQQQPSQAALMKQEPRQLAPLSPRAASDQKQPQSSAFIANALQQQQPSQPDERLELRDTIIGLQRELLDNNRTLLAQSEQLNAMRMHEQEVYHQQRQQPVRRQNEQQEPRPTRRVTPLSRPTALNLQDQNSNNSSLTDAAGVGITLHTPPPRSSSTTTTSSVAEAGLPSPRPRQPHQLSGSH